MTTERWQEKNASTKGPAEGLFVVPRKFIDHSAVSANLTLSSPSIKLKLLREHARTLTRCFVQAQFDFTVAKNFYNRRHA